MIQNFQPYLLCLIVYLLMVSFLLLGYFPPSSKLSRNSSSVNVPSFTSGTPVMKGFSSGGFLVSFVPLITISIRKPDYSATLKSS